MALVYLFRNLFFNFILFFRHWYWDSFYFVFGVLRGIILRLEKTLAVRVSFHFIFTPLYQEYNFFGYVIGFIFRSFKIVFGSLIYLVIFLVIALLYLVWVAAPIFLIYQIFYGGEIRFK